MPATDLLLRAIALQHPDDDDDFQDDDEDEDDEDEDSEDDEDEDDETEKWQVFCHIPPPSRLRFA